MALLQRLLCRMLPAAVGNGTLTDSEWASFTLNLDGKARRSLTLIDNPINVAILQCGIVGVNSITTAFSSSFTCLTVKIKAPQA